MARVGEGVFSICSVWDFLGFGAGFATGVIAGNVAVMPLS
jgi:hypothetical protein